MLEKWGPGVFLWGAKGLGELEALTRKGVPHRIGWVHTWLSLADPELGAETKIKLLVIHQILAIW